MTARTGGELPPFMRITLRAWVKSYRSLVTMLLSLLDLAIRLVIAQGVFASGLVKIANWETALTLSENEYPVSWMTPQSAAVLGVSIELIAPILLALGLGTRFAALSLFALFAVSQTEYLAIDTNLWVMALLGFFVLRGAGGISLDRMLAGGIGGSALPFARPVMSVLTFLSEFVAPVWTLLIRFWIAFALLCAAGVAADTKWSGVVPFTSFDGTQYFLAILLAAMLVLGLFLSLASAGLVLLLSTLAVLNPEQGITVYPYLLFMLLFLMRPTFLSVDAKISAWLESTIIFDQKYQDIPKNWPHVVVVGAGFGGIACVNNLKNMPVRITLIDRHNYHLFQPLLYQIATAALSPADVALPIRGLFKNDSNVRVLLGEVKGVDRGAQRISYGRNSMEYDYLVIATGASHSYFGRDEWAEFAPGLKTIEDGVSVRGHVLKAFERAEAADNAERSKRLMNFVVVGGGPTGVELAGAIAELAFQGLRGEYRGIDPADAQVMLVQSGDRILPAFAESLSIHAAKSLENLGVEIFLKSRVTDIFSDHVMIDGESRIDSETVLWAAGVIASPAAQWLGAECDRAGRVIVDEKLQIAGCENIFVIGDTAASMGWDGNPVPGLAPAAKQQGGYVASRIKSLLIGKGEGEDFVYQHRGSLATIGRKSAVADFGLVKMHGAPAWWFWGAVHIGFLSGMRNRVAVLLNWIWSYFTLKSGIRLITGRGSGT